MRLSPPTTTPDIERVVAMAWAVNPEPQTPNRKPLTLNPKPEILNPKP